MTRERGRSLPGVFWTAFKTQRTPIPRRFDHRPEYQLVLSPEFEQSTSDRALFFGLGFGNLPPDLSGATVGPYLIGGEKGIPCAINYVSPKPLYLWELPLDKLHLYLKVAFELAGDKQKSLFFHSAYALGCANQDCKNIDGITLVSPYIGKESLRAQIPFKIAERHFRNRIPKTLWSVDEYMDLSKPLFSGLLANGKKLIVDLGKYDRIIDNSVVSEAFEARFPQAEVRFSDRGHDLTQTQLHDLIAELLGYTPRLKTKAYSKARG